MGDVTDDAFSQQALRLRAAYQRKRQGTNLFPPIGQPVLEMELVHGTPPSMRIWYEDGTELGRHVHLFDLPRTLSGDILRLERELPSVSGHFEIKGDMIRQLDTCPPHPEPVEDDFEDISDLESRWGQRVAPEVRWDGGIADSGWSDVYDIGNCIKGMVYANAPITNQVERPIPEPLQAVVEACLREKPEERPTLKDLRGMVEEVEGGSC